MKKVIFTALCFGLLIAGSAFATDSNTTPPPPATCAPTCNGTAFETGSFMIKSVGTATAYGKETEVFTAGQHVLNMTIGNESNGVKFNAAGGYAAQDWGTGFKTVGGKAENWGQYGVFTQW